MMYLTDANIFIEAKNKYYSFDIAPAFWEWLDLAHSQDMACSIEPVCAELLEGNDELADWAQRNKNFFHPIDRGTEQHFPTLTSWAKSQDYTDSAVANFTENSTDYLLIAHASEHNHVVVTHERARPQARKRVLIPDACSAMKVTTTDTFQMLRRAGARFDLRPTNR